MTKKLTLTGGNFDDYLAGANGDDTLYGLGGNDTLIGNDGDDTLYGGTGNDVLEGGKGDDFLSGDQGADTMRGGAGNDLYIVDDVNDVVIENAGEGSLDTVRSSVSYNLAANVEVLLLTGNGNIDGGGNAMNNLVTGNAGNNILHGGGGTDILIGGGGNDSLYGDEGDDLLTGANGADLLDGGAGKDIMAGLGGDDRYMVDNSGDTVLELSNGGIDTVSSTVSWTLGSNLENLTLTGSGNINATGNKLANVIVGNAGANILTGGAGADTFTFLQPASLANIAVDTIADFSAAQGDKIDLTDLRGSLPLLWTQQQAAAFGVWQTGARLNIDLDGDSSADMTINVPGSSTTALELADFKGVVPGLVAVADSYSLLEDGMLSFDVTANDIGTATAVVRDGAGPQHGQLVASGNGFIYTPFADYHGSDSFDYHFENADGSSNSATVSLNIGAVNDAPASHNDSITLLPSTRHDFSASNFAFSDPHDAVNPDTLSAIRITNPSAGLFYDDNPVSGPLTVAVADIGHLNYRGAGNGSFNFQVVDSGAGNNTSAVYTMKENVAQIVETHPDGSASLDIGGQTWRVLAAAGFGSEAGMIPYAAILDTPGSSAGIDADDVVYLYAAKAGIDDDLPKVIADPFLSEIQTISSSTSDPIEVTALHVDGMGRNETIDLTMSVLGRERFTLDYHRDGQTITWIMRDANLPNSPLDAISTNYTDADFLSPYQDILPPHSFQGEVATVYGAFLDVHFYA